MVATPPDAETLQEIADRYGRSVDTLNSRWCLHPDWPAPVGRRRHAYVYDRAAVDAVVAQHFARKAATLAPDRLYTAKEIEAATGIKPATIRADVKKGRWPAADDTSERAHRWLGATVNEAVAKRRAYRRTADAGE
ncbi:helix-turn-helix transcriptional regulator [Streptomyces sp. NPDC001594]|uniref:helix-turn-helix transcriptional regulator n=1 Tax=Streptomyces sp. NPDC001594 TaxID=3364590 RepID=UPI0036813CAE